MNVLETKRQSRAYQKTLPLCPIYFLANGQRDIDMRSILAKSGSLTLDLGTETGFAEIGMSWIKEELPQSELHLTLVHETLTGISAPAMAKLLTDAMRDYLIETWDSSKFHLFLMSGGKDSRLIARLLSSLRKEFGNRWFGDIHIRCHEPEGEIFKAAMKRQGWHPDEYSVYREDQTQKEEYFIKLFDPDENPNGFYVSNINFFHDIIEENNIDFQNIQVINGNCATEILETTAHIGKWELSIPYITFQKRISPLKMVFSRDYLFWNSVLMPFASYDFLDIAFRIPTELHKTIRLSNGQVQPLLCIEMLKQFGDDIPFYIGHKYNFNVGSAKRDRMCQWWHGSKFYKRFSKHNETIRMLNPMTIEWGSPENKIYNLAATYEGVGF